MKNPLMTVILIAAALFLGWWMFTDPSSLADLTSDGAGTGWDALVVGFENVKDFVVELFG